MNLTNLQLHSKNAMLWWDIYQRSKTGRFAKIISFSLRGGNENSCKVEVIGKERALAMGKDSKYSVNSILVEMQNKLKDIFSILL